MIIAQNKIATTHFYKQEKLFVSVYKGRANVDLIIDHLKELITFYRKNKGAVEKSVVDVSHVLGSFAKVFKFLEQSYYPEAVKSGLICQAYVASDDLIVKNLSARLEMMAIEFNIKANVLHSVESAKKWLVANT